MVLMKIWSLVSSAKIFDERTVDFDHIDVEQLEIFEGHIAGAEIVDRDAAAESPSAYRRNCNRLVEILNGGGFSNLDNHAGQSYRGVEAGQTRCNVTSHS